jgi:hypothetical protein
MSFSKGIDIELNDLGNWFNELDEKTIEVLNESLISEELESGELNDPVELDNSTDMVCPFQMSECDNEDSTENTKIIIVDDILDKDPNILSSYEVMQYECHIAYFVQVLMEGSNGNNKIKSNKSYDNELTFDKMQSIVEYLSWISFASEILAKKINQEVLVYNPELKPSIVRSSYNFCTQYTRCKNFYSKHEIPTCKEHHYVHSLLKYDIDSVIIFLNYVVENKFTMTKEELNNLYLSIKTICFVTRHMSKEISYIDYITKNNSEAFHRNNPIDLVKKKILKKVWSENDRNIRTDRPMRKDRTDRSGQTHNFVVHTTIFNKNDKKIEYDKRKNSTFVKPNSCGFKRTDAIKINKPKDFANNRFSILSNI